MSATDYNSFNELEVEVKQDFYEDVQAAIADITECASLLELGADSDVINRMFRSLHTVKGNCNMVFLSSFVKASHKLEDLFSKIRSGNIEYNDVYGKFAVTIVGIIKTQLDNLMNNQTADDDILNKLELIVYCIEASPGESRLINTEKAIIAMQDGHYNLDLVALGRENGNAFSFLDATDSEFFQFISEQQSLRDPFNSKFICICEGLAKKINAMLGRSIDEQQLVAAIIFLNFSKNISLIENSDKLSTEQIFFSSGLLSRMAGWSIAADIILQINENHDGSGAPFGLKDDEIQPAAQALALAFEFSFIVTANLSQGYKNSLFTAVKAINAKKHSKYKERLIERFNQIIKTDYLTSHAW